ncbi:MAG: sigma-70 family RNA polymerase sigma factor, partial [Bdellovibrionota bacterium]
MRSLDAFTSEGERDFFLRLVELETRLISMAIHRGIFQEGVPRSRRDQIKDFIHPLLAKRNDTNFKTSHPDLLKEILVWDEMRDEFIRRNLGLVVHVVTRHSSKSDWEYHLGQQLFTLNLSFEGFEPSFGFKFSSYVYHSIRKRMRDDIRKLRSQTPLSSQAELLARKLLAANHERKILGLADLEMEEIETQFNVSTNQARQITKLLPLLNVVEIDAQVSPTEGAHKKDFIAAPDNSSRFDDLQRLEALLELSDFLPDEKMKLILKFFKQGRTQHEIAKHFGITKQGVMHHLRRASNYLRAILGLLSGAINEPRDRRLIMSYFGLFDFLKRPSTQLADEMRLKPKQ